MMYFLAIIVPPLAVLFSGKPLQALLNLVLTIMGYVPGVIHAILVVNDSKENKRNRKRIRAMKKAGRH